ncbi:MAG: hypothetical protein IJS33_05510 [Firmicutes bacterium]|nr:hypothetical protein [Bacillota bacterium]
MKKKRTKKDIGLLVAIIVVVCVFIVSCIPAGYAVYLGHRHQVYVGELTDSFYNARLKGGVMATYLGENYHLTPDEASNIYLIIMDAGVGKPRKEPPANEDLIEISFPDGAKLTLSGTEIMEKARKVDYGLYVKFETADGEVFEYDTDALEGIEWCRKILYRSR